MFWIFFFQRKKKHLPGRCCCRVRLFAAMDTPHICSTTWYRLVTCADVPIADASVLCPESPDKRWTGSDALACMLAFAKMWCKCGRDSSSEVTILLVRNAQHARTLCYLASKWQHGWWFGPCCSHLSGIPINPLPQLPCNCNQPSERLRRLHKSFQASHLYSPLTKTRMVMDMRHGRTQLIRSNQIEMTWEWKEHVRRRPRTVQLAIASPNSIIQDRWLGLLPPI